MIAPADWNFLILGAIIAALTQGARIYSGSDVPLFRVVLSSCFISGVAAFSLCGCLIIWMNTPPIASMFIGGIVGFAGGHWVLATMVQRGGEQLGAEPDDMEKVFKTLIEHISAEDQQGRK